MSSDRGTLGILVGGGPAPGINGVIAAATIEAKNNGLKVLGFYEGYKHLMAGREDQFTELDIEKVSRIHFLGGSILRTARANPTKKPESLETICRTLEKLGVKHLLTIGGDDTAFSASQVALKAGGRISVAHVPKTIDNDLPLPPSIPTFGYQTARAEGTRIVKNLMADAKTSPRWYIVVAMGRKAGHLALGIGKAAGAHLSVIPEEFGGRKVQFKEICDIVEGSILKRKSQHRDHGVAVLAEGLLESMSEDELKNVFGPDEIELDEHGHIKLDNLELGRKVRDELRRRFNKRGLKTTVINKNLGYELRCCDPVPFDCEYTRDLGYGAAKFLMAGGSNAIISFYGGAMRPLPFAEIEKDPVTGRPKVRMVEINTESYECARRYMIRLEKSDRNSSDSLQKLADAANLTAEQFQQHYGYLMQ
jgi:6-phosphofructokinase 1